MLLRHRSMPQTWPRNRAAGSTARATQTARPGPSRTRNGSRCRPGTRSSQAIPGPACRIPARWRCAQFRPVASDSARRPRPAQHFHALEIAETVEGRARTCVDHAVDDGGHASSTATENDSEPTPRMEKLNRRASSPDWKFSDGELLEIRRALSWPGPRGFYFDAQHAAPS